MRSVRRTNKRLVKLTAIGVAGLAAIGLSVLVLSPEREERIDPTRRGPLRFLRLTEARIHDRPAGAALVVRGETNLVAGARIDVTVVSRQHEILQVQATSDGSGFAVDTTAKGSVVEGTYDVTATFRLSDQTDAVRAELAYQPATLATRCGLSLPLQLARAADTRAQVRELFDAVNQQPRDATTIEALDKRAQELAAQLWIGEQKTALVKLRQALEEARRPDVRRREFDRLVLEAHVLAGL